MKSEDFQALLLSVVEQCINLKNKYVQEKNLPVDYICLFSHSPEEYADFFISASQIGSIVNETNTGPVFKFQIKLKTPAGEPNVLKIRTPDPTRPQRGDVDFTTDHPTFKKKYLGKEGFSLVKREKFEMLELRDNKYDVLVYFSSAPPSKLLGIG